jgi:hypothetical protein
MTRLSHNSGSPATFGPSEVLGSCRLWYHGSRLPGMSAGEEDRSLCNEARGLSGWPRKAARWAVLAAAVTLALAALLASHPRPARGAEPSAADRNHRRLPPLPW